MKLYAEQYNTIENKADQVGFYYLVDGIVTGAKDGDAEAQQSLKHFCNLYRAQNRINDYVGVVTLPETMEVVVVTFPIEQGDSIHPLQFDESLSRHFIYLDSIVDKQFTRPSIQNIVEEVRRGVI